MSNESFDKKIKSKFESFEPSYSEKDWKNFAPLLLPKKPFWAQALKPTAYGVAASAILVLSYFNLKLSDEKKQLQNTINQHTNSQNHIISASDKEGSKMSKTIRDTIYVIKEQSKVITKQSNNQPVVHHDTKNIVPALEIDIQKVTQQDNTQKAEKLISENELYVDKPLDNNVAKKNNIPVNTETNETSKPDNNYTLLTALPTALPSKVKSQMPLLPPAPEREWLTIKTPQITKPIKDKTSGIAIGIAGYTREYYKCAGVVLAYSINQHWEMNTGVLFGAQTLGDFDDDDEYRRKHNEDFPKKFPQPVPQNGKFRDIHACLKEIYIPIQAYYKYPINRYLQGVASVGTTLSLNVTEYYNYKYEENGQLIGNGSLPVKKKNDYFHSVIGSIGVQANWKKFSLRAEPYCNFEFKSPSPKTDLDNILGFRTQLLYNF